MAVKYKKSQLPHISVVIPAYKSERLLHRTICSVMGQPGVETEIIVIEDGVFDNTKDVVKSFNDPRIELITLTCNQGAQVARNTGLSKAKHDYVMFLDSDDYLEGKLLLGLHRAITASNASIALGPCKKVWEKSGKEYFFMPPVQEPIGIVRRWLLGNSGPAPCSILWNKNEVLRIGGWNPNITRNQDGELIIRAMLDDCSVSFSSHGFGVYWQHDSMQRVSKLRSESSYECRLEIEKLVTRWLDNNSYQEPIVFALYSFRLRTALHAYKNRLSNIGKIWEDRWRSNLPKRKTRYLFSLPNQLKVITFCSLMLGCKQTAKLMKIIQ